MEISSESSAELRESFALDRFVCGDSSGLDNSWKSVRADREDEHSLLDRLRSEGLGVLGLRGIPNGLEFEKHPIIFNYITVSFE